MNEWQLNAQRLLRKACTPWGIKASLVELDNYNAIFTRDAVMAGIAGILLEDEVIIKGLKNTLEQLKIRQGEQGQIASNFTIIDGQPDKVSFGTLSPKIDACTWYLMGVALLLRENKIEKKNFRESIEQTINLLDALEFNGKHLIYIPKGGNWADEYVYEGYILYDQVLRAWGLSLLATVFEVPDWAEKANAIMACISSSYQNENKPYLDASFYPGGRFEKFDLAAHALAGILFDDKQLDLEPVFDWITVHFMDKKQFPPAFYPVIKPGDSDWESLRNFHLFGFKNSPYHYHNGGIWWIWLGWLSIALSVRKQEAALLKLTELAISYLRSLEDFDFKEYISADERMPSGTPKLCYTAAGMVFLSLAKNKADFSLLKP